MGQNVTAADLDVRLEAVGHTVRREVLYELRHAAAEGTPAVQVESFYGAGDDSREVALRHRHLPKLSEFGFITVSEAGERIEPGPQFDELGPLLEHLASMDPVVADGGMVSRRR